MSWVGHKLALIFNLECLLNSISGTHFFWTFLENRPMAIFTKIKNEIFAS